MRLQHCRHLQRSTPPPCAITCRFADPAAPTSPSHPLQGNPLCSRREARGTCTEYYKNTLGEGRYALPLHGIASRAKAEELLAPPCYGLLALWIGGVVHEDDAVVAAVVEHVPAVDDHTAAADVPQLDDGVGGHDLEGG